MIRVHVICEGQTEEEFVRHILSRPLAMNNVFLSPSRIGRVGHKGGRVNLDRLVFDLKTRLLKDDQCHCTTLIDYYGLPADFPGIAEGKNFSDIKDKQRLVLMALSSLIDVQLGAAAARRFLPYVQMYEFEGLLFSAPEQLAKGIGQPGLTNIFKSIRRDYSSPEWINDNPNSAPSKRIEKVFNGYDKPDHPMLAAKNMGLDVIRHECHLFDAWVKQLEALSAGGFT